MSAEWARLLAGAALAAGVLSESLLELSPYTVWLLSAPGLFWCGAPYHRGLARGLASGRAGADMLLSIGLWAAFLFSTAAVFAPELLPPSARGHRLGTLWALALAPALGRKLGERLTERGEEAVSKILRRVPRSARLLEGGSERGVLSADLRQGDRVCVRPGEVLPVDGAVVSGSSRVDESLLTGSAVPVEKSAGSRVLAGTQNKDGELVVAVRAAGERTEVAELASSVLAGLGRKSVRSRLVDAAAEGCVPAVVLAAVGAALLWSWKGSEPRLAHALTALALSLVASCPWFAEFAGPAALAAAMQRAASMGVRIRNPGVLEDLAPPDVVLLDKKGILTTGRPEVGEVICFGRWREPELLRHACAAERGSGHPFSEALLARAPAGAASEPESIESYPGKGVAMTLGGRRVLAGSPAWLAEHGIEPAPRHAGRLRGRADPLMAVAVDGELAGVIVFRDALGPGVVEGVRALQELGLEVVLASGDQNAAAHAVAEQAGIGRVYAEVRREDKLEIIAQLQARGRRVVMVGEGWRDAAALSRADLGVAVAGRGARGPALGAGIDLGAESADIVLASRDLGQLAEALRLGLRIRGVIRENLGWAFGAHIVLIPAAAGALIPSFGLGLPPALLAGAAAASLAAIWLNSMWKLGGKGETKLA